MKKYITTVLGFAIIIALCVFACTSKQDRQKTQVGPGVILTKQDQLSRGKYLVNIMGCNDCHTPNIMTAHGPDKDSSRLLSGHPSGIALPVYDSKQTRSWALFSLTGTAIAGPWGVSYAANLTSDETGIGNWTEQQFFKAFRQGKYKGLDNSRTLLPPMPWQMYSQVTDADVSAIFAYLKSTTPVDNVVPAAVAPQDHP